MRGGGGVVAGGAVGYHGDVVVLPGSDVGKE